METPSAVLTPRRRIRSQDMSDIENGVVADKCFACHEKQQKYVCVNEWGIKTKNYTGVCRNKNCFRYEDVSKIHTWELVADK